MSVPQRAQTRSADGCVVIVGKESAGKSQLVGSLTGKVAYASNFRGSTIDCEVYRGLSWTFVDTPGILRRSDTLTTTLALNQLAINDRVMLVVRGTRLDEDLADLLPLVKGKLGVAVVTFWDKVHPNHNALQCLDSLSKNSGMSFIPVDARELSNDQRSRILREVTDARRIQHDRLGVRAGWQIEPPPTLLEQPFIGPLVSILLLLLPAILAVWAANDFAALVDPKIQLLLSSVMTLKASMPSLAQEVLFGKYGFVTMGPLLFVWSVPTIVLFAALLAGYKASGLLDRITVALHPLMRPFGLSGRDLVRVIMGYGCNVPAIVNTRSCSRCSRGTCVAAIAFGSACSYQLGATLSVFAASRRPWLVIPYLTFLTATALIYTRLTAPREARSKLNVLMAGGRTFIQVPRLRDIYSESRKTLIQFFRNAIPIFFLITVIASVLNWFSVLDKLAVVISPIMALFRLPADSALPVILASIRKDGILLFAEHGMVSELSAAQLLTGVYLAGVLLPCLVTVLTISREISWRFSVRLVARQAFFAVMFSMILAWGCALYR